MADLSEYRALDGIEFSPEVRKLMSLFAECWEECHADDCKTCKYRHGKNYYKLMYCLSERYADKLISKLLYELLLQEPPKEDANG